MPFTPQFDSHQQSYYPANTATYMPTTTTVQNPVFDGQQWTAGAGPSYQSWPEMYTDPAASYYPPPSSGRPPAQNVALPPPQGQIVDAGAGQAFQWEEPSQDHWMYHQPCYAPSQLSPHSSPPTGTPSPPASPTNSAGQSQRSAHYRRPVVSSATEFVHKPYARPVACLPCRRVKMRCESREDGKRCQRCERNNLECVVPEKPKQRVVGKKEHLLTLLREKDALIEQLLKENLTYKIGAHAHAHAPAPPLGPRQ